MGATSGSGWILHVSSVFSGPFVNCVGHPRHLVYRNHKIPVVTSVRIVKLLRSFYKILWFALPCLYYKEGISARYQGFDGLWSPVLTQNSHEFHCSLTTCTRAVEPLNSIFAFDLQKQPKLPWVSQLLQKYAFYFLTFSHLNNSFIIWAEVSPKTKNALNKWLKSLQCFQITGWSHGKEKKKQNSSRNQLRLMHLYFSAIFFFTSPDLKHVFP